MYGRNEKCLQNFGWKTSREERGRWEENTMNSSWKGAVVSFCGHSVEPLGSLKVGDILIS
jgi:hypothetical protein